MHVAEGVPRANATKIWLTQSGKTILANRHTEIPAVELRKLLRRQRKELNMIIKPSSALRNNYSGISILAKQTQEPVYITVNGEGDGVFMDMEAFERREQLLNLRAQVLQAEEDRLHGAKTMSISEAREVLKKI